MSPHLWLTEHGDSPPPRAFAYALKQARTYREMVRALDAEADAREEAEIVVAQALLARFAGDASAEGWLGADDVAAVVGDDDAAAYAVLDGLWERGCECARCGARSVPPPSRWRAGVNTT